MPRKLHRLPRKPYPQRNRIRICWLPSKTRVSCSFRTTSSVLISQRPYCVYSGIIIIIIITTIIIMGFSRVSELP
jgi:hypothetical protein